MNASAGVSSPSLPNEICGLCRYATARTDPFGGSCASSSPQIQVDYVVSLHAVSSACRLSVNVLLMTGSDEFQARLVFF